MGVPQFKGKVEEKVFSRKVEYPNEDVYIGIFKDGKRQGKGVYKCKNGSKYEGEWFENMKQGKGRYYYKLTGECYFGQWMNNKKEGQGTYMYRDQSRYTGRWKNNLKCGYGIFQKPNFSGWKGNWLNNKRHGNGIAFESNGVNIKEKYDRGILIWKEDKEPEIMKKRKNSLGSSEDEKMVSFIEFGDGLIEEMGYDQLNPTKWTIKNVFQFLKHLGLGKYSSMFEYHRINGMLLLKSNESDLKDIGVCIKGHRIKLRVAIKKLRRLTKKEARINFEKKQKDTPKFSNLLHNSYLDLYNESMEHKLRSYYENLNIVKEEEEEGSISYQKNLHVQKRPKIIEAFSKVDGGSKKESTASTPDQTEEHQKFGDLQDMDLLKERSLSSPAMAKRRTLSENDIQISPEKKHFSKDDNFTGEEEKLRVIQEKELEMDRSFLSDQKSNCIEQWEVQSNEAQPTSSSSSSSDSSESIQSKDTKTQKLRVTTMSNHLFFDLKKIKNFVPVSTKSYCVSYKGLYSSQKVWIKKYLRKGKKYLEKEDKILEESSLIYKMNHKNIVRFFGTSVIGNHFYTITEYMENGSVYDQLHIFKKKFDQKFVMKILLSVSRAMNFLHGVKKRHGDLSSTNVLISEDWEIKLVDFGFTGLKEKFKRFRKLKKRKDADTPYWLAPEILEEKKFGKEVDVYSFGIFIWEILSRKIPYEEWSLEDMINRIGKNKYYKVPHPNTSSSEALINLMYDCLKRNPAQRPTFSQITATLENFKNLQDLYLINELNKYFGTL